MPLLSKVKGKVRATISQYIGNQADQNDLSARHRSTPTEARPVSGLRWLTQTKTPGLLARPRRALSGIPSVYAHGLAWRPTWL